MRAWLVAMRLKTVDNILTTNIMDYRLNSPFISLIKLSHSPQQIIHIFLSLYSLAYIIHMNEMFMHYGVLGFWGFGEWIRKVLETSCI